MGRIEFSWERWSLDWKIGGWVGRMEVGRKNGSWVGRMEVGWEEVRMCGKDGGWVEKKEVW